MSIRASSVEALASRLVGTWLLGKYRIEKLLGWGGAAMVFAAVHRNGLRVAVKLLHPEVAADETVRSRFLREGYLANHVGHPGAVRVLDDDRLPDGSVFLVMELLEGQTLDARAAAAQGRLPLKLVCNVGYQLCDVLGAAHDKGIAHRDIKPANLFLTDEGSVKVLDFGLARIHHNQADALQSLTQTGDVFGTPAFMAPEQAIGDMAHVDPSSDQWSAAASLFHLATGAFVHDARSANEMMIFCATRPARSIRDADPQIPARIADVIDRALRFEKGERWPHVRDFQRALQLAYEATYGAALAMPRIAPATTSIAPLGMPVASARTRGVRLAVAATTAAIVTGLGIIAVRAVVAKPAPAALEARAVDAPPSAEPAAQQPPIGPAPPSPPAEVPSSSASTMPAATSKPTASAPARSTGKPASAKRDPWSTQ